jgi:hypothetical protein
MTGQFDVAVASTQSPAAQISEFVDSVINTQLEQTAKVVADMLSFVQIARDHATQQLNNHQHGDAMEPHDKMWDRFVEIDSRQKMLHRKLQMIRAAQAYKGE